MARTQVVRTPKGHAKADEQLRSPVESRVQAPVRIVSHQSEISLGAPCQQYFPISVQGEREGVVRRTAWKCRSDYSSSAPGGIKIALRRLQRLQTEDRKEPQSGRNMPFMGEKKLRQLKLSSPSDLNQ